MELGIHFHDVSYHYPGKGGAALEHVAFTIPRSSIFALLGPNGAGKTTLLRILCGRLQGYTGSFQIPQDWADQSGKLNPQKYGVLVEQPGIYARLSVQEYLEFFGSFYRIPDLKKRILQLATRVEFGNLKQPMSKLSLGMRQKVQIMRTFLHSPALVLLDEPTANLDPIAREALWSMVVQANRELGTTFIVCSHLLGEMEQHCTDLGFLRSGKICASGSQQAIRHSHQATTRVSVLLTEPWAGQALDSIIPGMIDVKCHESEIHFECEHPERTNPALISYLVLHGAQIVEISVHRPKLGEIYRHFVEGKVS